MLDVRVVGQDGTSCVECQESRVEIAHQQGLLSPKSSLDAQVKAQLRLMELTANLDALTGGAFSSAVKG